MKKQFTFLLTLLTTFVFGQNYHDTQGKLEISNSGQATYTLPIALPPSISSVGPTINLVYASGQNGGIAGQGWNINSISYISRMATRLDIDGFKDGVDFDDNDKLALDGQRLLLKTGIYWADGSTYETEVQSNTKIELKINGTVTYFIVTAPDGSRSWYGNYPSSSMNATDLSAYYIVRFEDAEGNFIVYNYSKPLGKSLCIDTIQFSANVNTNPSPLNYIKFTYTTAARTEKAYFKGLLVEKAELLNNIKVYTNTYLFKEYVIANSVADSNGYQRVTQIQEKNGAGEVANPVVFDYDTTTSTNVNSEIVKSYYNNISFNNTQLAGDFDGDGRLDFIADNNLYTKVFDGNSGGNPINLPFTTNSRQTFPSVTKDGALLNQFQSIVRANESANAVNFEIYNKNPDGSPYAIGVTLNYIKPILIDNSPATVHQANLDTSTVSTEIFTGDSTQNCTVPTTRKSNGYLEGDFNGDGVGDVLITRKINERYYYVTNTATSLNTYPQQVFDSGICWCWTTVQKHWKKITCETKTVDDGDELYYVNLDPNASTNLGENGYVKLNIDSAFSVDSKKIIADFNGDGKSDIMLIKSNGTYILYSFNMLLASPWVQLEILGQGTLSQYSTTKQLLLGDFNGDGKTDILLPNQDGDGCEDQTWCDDWTINYSNPKLLGGSLFEAQQFDITRYMPKREYDTSTINNAYYALDVNKDGKTDLVRVERAYYKPNWTINDHNTRWTVDTYVNNIGLTGGNGFAHDYTTPCVSYGGGMFTDCQHDSDNNWFPIPIASSFKQNGINNELVMVQEQNNSLTYINFSKDFNRDNALKKVTQSNGAIVDEISYAPMESSTANYGFGAATDFYSSANSVNYPLVELKQIPSNRLVSQLKNTSVGVVKYQNFRYNGYVVSLSGIGSVGFNKTARCAWYVNPADKKTWTVTENDPLKRGATTLTYTLLPSANNFSFPTNLTTGLWSKSENNFTQSTDPITKRYVMLLQSQKTTDYLTGIVKQKIYNTYSSDYFLPTSVTSNNYLGTTLRGSTLTETSYGTNVTAGAVGSAYYIGRPISTTTTTTAYGDVKKATQTLTYTNGNVTEIDKQVYANGSTTTLDPVTMVEKMTYYTNGLLKDKEVSATGTTAGVNDVTPRKVSYTYDPSNRFFKTVTDAEGMMIANLIISPLYGIVSKTSNSFGQYTYTNYDNWGKQTSVTDELGLITNYAYVRTGNIYTTTITKTNSANVSDGSSSMVDQDVLAREVRRGSKNLNGTWTYVNTEYDNYGRKYRTSEPYFASGTPTQWTVYVYDDYSRPTSTTSYTTKVVTTTYNGTTATAADTVMSKSKTVDANGNVVSATDAPGGMITYNYDASNNLLESNYDGIKTTMTYDNWGRKTQLVDTSSGTYTYSYDAYGQVKTEGAPKGTTTYTYDGLSGRVLTKSVQGLVAADGTNIVSTYTYNSTTKLLSSLAVTNPNDGNSNFAYTYDPQRRLYKTVETQNLQPTGTAVFTKELAFDTFSRVATETSSATAFGKTSSKVIKHNYSANNGAENQLIDNGTQANVWQANTVDARNNILTATLGNGIAITNTFDTYGYASQFQHKLGTTNVMTLNTSFDPVLGNLTNRYNSMFDYREIFKYDALDRLTEWDGSGTIVVNNGQYNLDCTQGQGQGQDQGGDCQFVINSNGNLNVHLERDPIFEDLSSLTINTGDKLRVKTTISNFSGTQNVIVDVIMVETDPNDSTHTNQIVIGTLNNGTFDAIYTASSFVANPILSLKFIIDPSSPRGDYYGTPVDPYANFQIDNLMLFSVVINTQNYDDRGRITDNKVGHYNYNSAKPYQNNSIVPQYSSILSVPMTTAQSITYNAFKAPIQISSSNTNLTKISFGYNANEQRSVMYYGSNATDKLARPYRRYYSADGSMEVTATFAAGNTTTPTAVAFLTYIGGSAYSAPAVVKSDGTTQNYFYLHRDYQSSILAITNAAGGVVEKRLFDPWGAVTKIQDGAGVNLAKLTFFDRGYTGHEHLQSVGLLNMNARLYDPNIHRFLEADNYVQDINNTQNYNRYGYCVNNPTKYTDVTGNVFGIDDAIIIAVVVAALSYTGTALLADVPFSVGGLIQSCAIAAGTAAVTFGVSSSFTSICNFTSTATGFWSGAAIGSSTGFVTGIAGSAINTLASGGSIKLMQLLKDGMVGAVIGGVVEGISGGLNAREGDSNFWTGKKMLDTSQGIGAHTAEAKAIVEKGSIMGKYVGKFEGVNVYESSELGVGKAAGGLTLPPNRITVGKNVFSKGGYSKGIFKYSEYQDLVHHEFGHILEYRQSFVGLDGFYKIIAVESLATSSTSVADTWWTETWANQLSSNYFGYGFYDDIKYPCAELSEFNRVKFYLK